MPNFIHLVYVPFRGVGVDLRDDAWFEERVLIFKRYTLQSLLNQSNRNFILWISFRPEDQPSPIVARLAAHLRETDMQFVFTFEGLMYHDDKFGGGLKQTLKNAGRVIRFAWRNNQWSTLVTSLIQICSDKNKMLLQRLEHPLQQLKQYFGETDRVLMTRIDSDDMFRFDAIQIIQNARQELPEYNAIAFLGGYVYNSTTNEMAEWNTQTNPPFHTIVFPAETFFHPANHLAHYKNYKSHEDIPEIFNTINLTDRAYCVVTHNPKAHISTTWNHPFRGKILDREVLSQFL